MTRFPSVSPPDIDFMENVLNYLSENGELRLLDLRKKFGNKVKDALYVLRALNIVAYKGKGRNLQYYITSRRSIATAFIANNDTRNVLKAISEGKNKRKDVANIVFGSSQKTNLKRVTGIVTLARSIGFMPKGRKYTATELGVKELVRYFVELAYKDLVKKNPISYVKIFEVRDNVLKDLKIPKKLFDKSLLQLHFEGDIYLSAAPAMTDEDIEHGIVTPQGVLTFVKIDKFKYIEE